MGIIGKYIDHCCENHPQLMRAVLERPLAPLEKWIDWDAEGGPCGCLIGTSALAAGYEGWRIGDEHFGTGCGHVAKFIGWDHRVVETVGVHVAGLTGRLASDARAVHLMRQRIARQLAIRESRMVGIAALPNEPVELPAIELSALPAPPTTPRGAG